MEKLDHSHSSGLKGKNASITLFSARQMSKSQNVSDITILRARWLSWGQHVTHENMAQGWPDSHSEIRLKEGFYIFETSQRDLKIIT